MKPITQLKELFAENLIDFYQVGENVLVVTNLFENENDNVIFTVGVSTVDAMHVNYETGKIELLSGGLNMITLFIIKNIDVIMNAHGKHKEDINSLLTNLNIKHYEN